MGCVCVCVCRVALFVSHLSRQAMAWFKWCVRCGQCSAADDHSYRPSQCFGVVNSSTAFDVIISDTYSERVCVCSAVSAEGQCLYRHSVVYSGSDSHNYDASLFVNLRCATRTSFRSYCVL